jgi:hypothetical protein
MKHQLVLAAVAAVAMVAASALTAPSRGATPPSPGAQAMMAVEIYQCPRDGLIYTAPVRGTYFCEVDGRKLKWIGTR